MDGQVTTDDYVAVDLNLGKGSSDPLAFAETRNEMIALHAERFGADYLTKLAYAEAYGFAALVPEPSCASLLAPTIFVLRRRRLHTFA